MTISDVVFLCLLGLLGLGIGIWLAVRFVIAVWARWIRLRDRVQSCLRRWKAERKDLYQRLREWLRLLILQLLRAALYVAMVLLAAVAAPTLFLFFGRLIGSFKPDVLHDEAAIALVAAGSGFVIAIAVSTLRGRRVALAEQLLGKLVGWVTPDGGHQVAIVDFWPMSQGWREGIITHHYGLEKAPLRASEWLVALHQVGGVCRGSHSLAFLKSQIEALELRGAVAKQEWKNAPKCGSETCPPPPPAPEPKWVCFVSLNGRFHAMQPWNVFRYQIVTKENAAYPRILNASTEKAFFEEITKNMEQSRPQTNNGEPQYYSDAVPGLERFWIEADTTNENALKILAENNRGRAMVVHSKKEGGPWGVVTLGALAESVLFKLLRELKLTGLQPHSGRSGSTPPGLDVTG
jgi:hypothetical protein